MNLVLMGLRAAGKTTIGRGVAVRLGIPFVDLDDETCAQLGCASVREAWSRYGEPAFRAGELAALRGLMTAPSTPRVIALGGGTPMIPGVAGLLRATRTIYLRARPATLQARLHEEPGDRASLTTAGLVDEVPVIWEARDAVYRAIAHVTVEVDDLSVNDAVEQVLRYWNPAT